MPERDPHTGPERRLYHPFDAWPSLPQEPFASAVRLRLHLGKIGRHIKPNDVRITELLATHGAILLRATSDAVFFARPAAEPPTEALITLVANTRDNAGFNPMMGAAAGLQPPTPDTSDLTPQNVFYGHPETEVIAGGFYTQDRHGAVSVFRAVVADLARRPTITSIAVEINVTGGDANLVHSAVVQALKDVRFGKAVSAYTFGGGGPDDTHWSHVRGPVQPS